jgi:hypothetical protein
MSQSTTLEDRRPHRSTPSQERPLLLTSVHPVSSIRTIPCPSQKTHTSCVCTHFSDPYAVVSFSTDSYTPVKSWGLALIPFIIPQPPRVRQSLLLAAPYDHRLAPQTNPSLFYAHLSSLVRTQEIAPGQTCLTPSWNCSGPRTFNPILKLQVGFQKRRYSLVVWVFYQSY